MPDFSFPIDNKGATEQNLKLNQMPNEGFLRIIGI